MMTLEAMPPGVRLTNRRAVAAGRVARARAALADCHLCAHRCGVNRLAGELGLCRADDRPRVFQVQVEVGEELELIPTLAVALSGCDLRCAFCVTGAQSWNPRAGDPMTPATLARRAEAALANGARTITILGGEPTIYPLFLLELVAALPGWAKLVLKTNAYGSAAGRELLAGLFDVWCADFKFGNDACAERLARVADYNSTVRETLLWAAEQGDLIIRHLLMPGHVGCCWSPVAEWLAAHLPNVKVSLRQGFWPGWQAHRHPELRRTTSEREARRAREIAAEWGLNLIE